MIAPLACPVRASWLSSSLGLELLGGEREIRGVCGLDALEEHRLSFALPPRRADGAKGGVLFGLRELAGGAASVIASPKPRLDFIRAQHLLQETPGFELPAGKPAVHPSAVIEPGAFLEDGVQVGEGTVVGANAVLRRGTRVGRFCEIQSGAVIGGCGFGFERDEQGRPWRMLHLGGVLIGDRVEVGALATVARGALGDTVLGDDVKIDAHAHIAHNCVVGRGTIITACAELSGSVKVGERCWIAPNAAVRQKLKIGDAAFIGIGAVVLYDVAAGAKVFGNPAAPLRV